MTDQDILDYLAAGAARLKEVCGTTCSVQAEACEYKTTLQGFVAYCENSPHEHFSGRCATLDEAIEFHAAQFRGESGALAEQLKQAIQRHKAAVERLQLKLDNLQPE